MMGTIPTLTTPTLTPTTLRNFEASIIAGLDPEESELLLNPSLHTGQTGSFVPPLPTTSTTASTTTININTWQGGSISNTSNNQEEEEEDAESMPPAAPAAAVGGPKGKKKPATTRRGGKRTTGGRKPKLDRNLSPEEEERRRTRRERNKQAAARCRKRRVDQTNLLIEETEELEATKRQIQEQITSLQNERDELEFLLQTHRHCTKLQKKSGPGPVPVPTTTAQNNQAPQQQQQQQLKRPTTLPVKNASTPDGGGGMELSTPSNGLLSFDLDWSELPSSSITPLITPGTASELLKGLETPTTSAGRIKME